MKRLLVILLSIVTLSACAESHEVYEHDAGAAYDDEDAGPVEVQAEALISCGTYAKYLTEVTHPIQLDWSYQWAGPGRVRIFLGTPVYYKRNPVDPQILPIVPGYFPNEVQALVNFKNVLSCKAVLFTFKGGVQRTTSTANTQIL